MKPDSPFNQIVSDYVLGQQFRRFRDQSSTNRYYINKVKGDDIEQLFIGWICSRGSLFAYLYKEMKREAKEEKRLTLASKIARAGFLPELGALRVWLGQHPNALIVPVPSRYGVSEEFARQLSELLGHVTLLQIIQRSNSGEIKLVPNWEMREPLADQLLSIDQTVTLHRQPVLLVDDILSSGSTIRKSAQLLKSRGAASIVAALPATNLYDSHH